MKAEVKYWPDTGNVDLVITTESETEFAMLGLLQSREPKWDRSTHHGQVGLTFVMPRIVKQAEIIAPTHPDTRRP